MISTVHPHLFLNTDPNLLSLELIEELQKNIEGYKTEYAELITEKENIKNEMSKVQEKVERSRKLINVSHPSLLPI